MSTKPGVVVQITDTHLFADKREQLKGVVTYESFNKVLSHSIRSYPRADAYLFTGDLSQDGSAQSYLDFKTSIGRITAPCYVIPGNHDDVTNMKQHLLADSIRFEPYTDLGQWRIIFINTQTPGQVYGSIIDEELERFRKSVKPGLGNHLVCLHHPPVIMGSEWLDPIGLRNGEAFFEVVDRIEGNRILLWGHAHQEYHEQRGEMALLGSPSTCVQFKPGGSELVLDDLSPGYRVLQLYDDGQFETHVVRVG